MRRAARSGQKPKDSAARKNRQNDEHTNVMFEKIDYLSGCHPRLLQWVRVEIDDTRDARIK